MCGQIYKALLASIQPFFGETWSLPKRCPFVCFDASIVTTAVLAQAEECQL